MKKIAIITAIIALALMFMGCPSAGLTGLHDTPASYVTLEVKNFPVTDGDYCFVGLFKDKGWNEKERSFKISGGKGSFTDSASTMIIEGTFKFSVVQKDTWNRTWYGKTSGNEDDYGALRNFRVTIPMDGATHKVTVDGSTDPATLTVQ